MKRSPCSHKLNILNKTFIFAVLYSFGIFWQHMYILRISVLPLLDSGTLPRRQSYLKIFPLIVNIALVGVLLINSTFPMEEISCYRQHHIVPDQTLVWMYKNQVLFLSTKIKMTLI